MSDERETTEDLPEDIARLLRDVAAADPELRDAHISGALSAMTRSNVVRVDFRRRALLSVAAAAVVVLAAGAGWAARGSRTTSVVAPAADMSSDTQAASATATTDSAATAKGSSYSSPTTLPCADAVKNSSYVGEYKSPVDGRAYVVFSANGYLQFVDKESCAVVQVSPTTSAP